MTGLFFPIVPQSGTITKNYYDVCEVPQWLGYDREEDDLQERLQTGTRNKTLVAAGDANYPEGIEGPPLLHTQKGKK